MRAIVFSFLFVVSFALAKQVQLSSILSLNLGDPVKNYKKSFSNEKFSYEIESEDGKLKSLRVDFIELVESKKIIKNDISGYCFAQPSGGDFIRYRYFFFNKELNKRFEVAPNKKLKSVIIQSMPDAKKFRVCSFSEVIPEKKEKQVRRLK